MTVARLMILLIYGNPIELKYFMDVKKAIIENPNNQAPCKFSLCSIILHSILARILRGILSSMSHTSVFKMLTKQAFQDCKERCD
jgi:hypothetical protein